MTERLTRRAVLAAASGGTAATAGCFSSLRSRVAYTPSQQVSLSVKAVPTDRDPSATAVARALRDNLEAVGVDVTLELLGQGQLLRDVLMNHEFDCAVARVPAHREPDELRTLLHSAFAEEEGWQNPGGVAHRGLDRQLERQRRRGTDRADALRAVQRTLRAEQQVVPVAAPSYLGLLDDELAPPEAAPLGDPLSYLLLAPEADDRLEVQLLYPDVTTNPNLLGVEFRAREQLLELLYDRLARRVDGEVVPWLARDWRLVPGGVVVELRPDLQWHDGTAITAEDLAFTYRFFQDTTLGAADSPVPAPRFRSQTSLVERASVLDERRVRLDLGDARHSLAPHALTVPLLPAGEWRERAELEREYLPRALVEPVEEPVGSGPLALESIETEDSMTLERFDEHFLVTADELPAALEPFRGGPAYETLEALWATNPGAAINAVAEGDGHVVEGSLPPVRAPTVRDTPGVRLVEAPPNAYYALLFNVRRSPLSHYGFRRATARLLDREFLLESVFEGFATATGSPLQDPDHVPDGPEWNEEELAFPGEDGELDVEAARAAFADAGFRFHQGELYARE